MPTSASKVDALEDRIETLERLMGRQFRGMEHRLEVLEQQLQRGQGLRSRKNTSLGRRNTSWDSQSQVRWHPGRCGPTFATDRDHEDLFAPPNDCINGTSGSFHPHQRRSSLADIAEQFHFDNASQCLALCAQCQRCAAVSYSYKRQDCAWFAHCDPSHLIEKKKGYHTAMMTDELRGSIDTRSCQDTSTGRRRAQSVPRVAFLVAGRIGSFSQPNVYRSYGEYVVKSFGAHSDSRIFLVLKRSGPGQVMGALQIRDDIEASRSLCSPTHQNPRTLRLAPRKWPLRLST